MTDFRDLSVLPEDQAYWEGLEQRIVAELGPRVPARADAWWTPLAARAWMLGGLSAAATIAALLLMPARDEGRRAPESSLLLLTNSDPAFVRFVSAPAPPSVGSLLLPVPERSQ